jgi:hypothetical protein
MDVAAAGQMIIFFSVLVGMILVGGLVLAYIGYSFLHVLIGTASGNDAIAWPGDPFFDWMFKGWYLAWIAVMSALPAILIIAVARIHAADPRWMFLLAASVCLCLPIFLLSSMSGPSRMLLVRGEILGGMCRRFGLVLVFYILSALVVVGCCAFLWFALVEWSIAIVPLATITLAIGMLIYARLVGRLGHAITEEPRREKSTKEASPGDKRAKSTRDKWGTPEITLPHDADHKSKPAAKKRREKKSSANVVDPWAIPELEKPAKLKRSQPAVNDPLGPAEGGYDLAADKKKPSPPAKGGKVAGTMEEQDAHLMAPDDRPPEIKPTPARAQTGVSAYEAALAAPKQRPALPANPMLSGVLAFPFYPTSLGPLCTMAIGLSILGMLGRALIALFP